MLGFDRTQIAKWVNWIGYLFALLGGCATREASFGHKINDWGHAHPVLVLIVTVVILIAAILDLADGVPNVFAIGVALLFPSFMHPIGAVGGVVGWALDYPFQALNDYLGVHLAWLIGQAGAGGLANLSAITWGVAFGCLIVAKIRNRQARRAANGGAGGGAAARSFARTGR